MSPEGAAELRMKLNCQAALERDSRSVLCWLDLALTAAMNALIRIIAGRRVIRIPWEEVKHITSVIELNGAAAQYGLGRKQNFGAAIEPDTRR
jgi:hypothetical protein